MKKEITKKLSVLWKSIFYLLSLFSLFTIIGIFVAPEIPGIGLVLKILLITSFLINLLGLYGLAWRKKIANMFFWKGFFVAVIIFNIYYGIVGIEGLPPMTTFDMIASLILTLMMYVPIYFYAFHSKHIWGK